MIIPLLSTMLEDNSISNNLFVEISNFISKIFGNKPNLNSFLIIYFLIIFFQLLFTLLTSFYQSIILNNFSYKLKDNLFNSIMNTTWEYILGKKVEKHSNQILNDTNRTAACFRILLQIVKSIFLVLFYLCVAIINSPYLIMIITIVTLFMFLITMPLSKKSKNIGESLTLVNESMLSKIQDSFMNFKLIKIFSNEKLIREKVQKVFKENRKVYIHADLMQNFIIFILSFWGVLTLCLILWATQKIFYENSIVIIVTLYLYLRIYNQLTNIYQDHNAFLMGFDGFKNLMNEYKLTILNTEINPKKKKKVKSTSPSIELKNILMKYGQKVVHKNFSLKINSNQCIGIFGKSGSGKSSLIDLITGLIMPKKGDILIDGTNIKEIDLNSWRSNIGYVTQYTYLIDGTIEENINFSNKKISKEKLYDILDSVGVSEFVKNKENKLDTQIDIRSTKLSGGERQRLGIARALIGDKKLLIFDEPTSSLDAKNEKKIISVIKKFKGEKTIILISHNLNVLKFCEKIINI